MKMHVRGGMQLPLTCLWWPLSLPNISVFLRVKASVLSLSHRLHPVRERVQAPRREAFKESVDGRGVRVTLRLCQAATPGRWSPGHLGRWSEALGSSHGSTPAAHSHLSLILGSSPSMEGVLIRRASYQHRLIKLVVLAVFCGGFFYLVGEAPASPLDGHISASAQSSLLRDTLSYGETFLNARLRASDTDDTSCLNPGGKGTKDQICAYVKANCSDPDNGYIDYLELFYCSSWLGTNRALGWVTMVAWLLFLFLCLGVLSNEYSVPSLTAVAYYLKIPAEVAGLTLLALGNGVANVSGYFAAVTNRTYSLAIGDAFGGSFFTITIVLSCICCFGKNILLDGRSFIRDILFLFTASVAVFIFVCTGRIYIYESVALLVFYIVYVLYAVIYDLMRQRRKRIQMKRARIAAGQADSQPAIYRRHSGILKSSVILKSSTELRSSQASLPAHEGSPVPSPQSSPLKTSNRHFADPSNSSPRGPKTEPTVRLSDGEVGVDKPFPPISANEDLAIELKDASSLRDLSAALNKVADPGSVVGRSLSAEMNDDVEDILAPPLQGETADDNAETDGTLVIPNIHLYQEAMEEELTEIRERGSYIWTFDRWRESFNKLTWLGKMFYIFTYIMNIPLWITIPVTRWNRPAALASIVLGWPVIFAALNLVTKKIPGIDVPVLSVCVGGAAIIMLVAFFTTETERPPRYRILFLLWGFIIAIFWNYLVANELVNLLQAAGRILSIADILLGATILTWGNCVSDLVADSTLAASGQARIAMGALYGGPMFSTYLRAIRPLVSAQSLGRSKHRDPTESPCPTAQAL